MSEKNSFIATQDIRRSPARARLAHTYALNIGSVNENNNEFCRKKERDEKVSYRKLIFGCNIKFQVMPVN